MYVSNYWGPSDGILKHLYYLEYFSHDIQNSFKYPYYRSIMEIISHMVDGVCKKVGTRCFLPGAKIDKEVKPMTW